jgi:hypothetical protein
MEQKGQVEGTHVGDEGFRTSRGLALLRQYATQASTDVKFDTLTSNTADKLGALAKWWHDTYGQMEGFEEMYVTATTNGSHSPTSYHYHGQAADVAMDLLEQNYGIRQAFVAKARELGFGGDEINEYDNPSEWSSGGHMHLANPDDASLPLNAGASGTPNAAQQSQTSDGAITSPDQAIRNAMGLAAGMRSQINKFTGLADSSRDKVASGQLVIGNASTLGMLRGNMMNYRGVQEDFEKHSGITDASRLGYGLQGAFTVENGIATFRGMSAIQRRRDFDRNMRGARFNFVEDGERELRDTVDALMRKTDETRAENERRYAETHPTERTKTHCQVTVLSQLRTQPVMQQNSMERARRTAAANSQKKER